MFNQYPYQNFNDFNLDWILKKVKDLIEDLTSLSEWKDETQAEIDKLNELYNDLVNGNFTPEFLNSLHKWLEQNALDIIGELSTHVFFGLTDTGYFVAYIPESWNDIVFNTSGLDTTISGVEYGHLILSY